MTLRVVCDTNTRVSALVFKGVPKLAVDLASAPFFRQFVATALIQEFRGILETKFIHKIISLDAAVSELHLCAFLVNPTETTTACRDPDDNRVLECAIAAGADVIVSGDRDLLVLGCFR